MPSSDYASAVSGGLKLKGAKDAGIKKKSKKSKSSKDKAPEATNSEEVAGSGGSEAAAPSDKTLALTNTPSDPERDTTPITAGTGTGKTEAQRRHEEIKRKRVRPVQSSPLKRYHIGFIKP
jgi:protein FAM32A